MTCLLKIEKLKKNGSLLTVYFEHNEIQKVNHKTNEKNLVPYFKLLKEKINLITLISIILAMIGLATLKLR